MLASMRKYIRTRIPGGTNFFTVNMAVREGNRLLVERIDTLREAYRATRNERQFRTEAIVVLPEHMHALWTLPEGDTDFSTRWALIKARFTRAIERTKVCSMSRLRRRERGIWQRRFYEHAIRDENDFTQHIEYIHRNPVKHGWVEHVVDWPHSSFHRLVRLGQAPADWGG